MITASILLVSALKTYVVVGLISVAILPRTRRLLAAAFSRTGLHRTPAWAFALYCAGVAATTVLAWPHLLRRAYVTPPLAAPAQRRLH